MDTLKQQAYTTAVGSIVPDRRLPSNIFRGEWHSYFFFDMFELFGRQFVDIKNLFLETEGTEVLCIINLGVHTPTDTSTLLALYLDRQTNSESYITSLNNLPSTTSDQGTILSWQMFVDRYVFSSESGEWCIYFEKEEDVGVVAFRTETGAEKFSQVLEIMSARPLHLAIQPYPQGGSILGNLVDSWRKSLIENYAPSKQ